MAETTVTFDGIELTERFVCSDLARQFIPRTVGTAQVPGMDGVLFTGVSADPIEIGMTMTAVDRDPAARSEAWRWLASVLAATTPRPLAISDDGGKHYMAVPHGGDVERFVNAERAEMGFMCPDPAMYGDAGSAEVDGSATFEVGGNAKTMPAISMPAIQGGSDGLYTLVLDGEAEFSFACSQSGSTAAEADCASRRLTVAGAAKLPTLASDWLELAPGEHTVEVTAGSGACTLSWTERWL